MIPRSCLSFPILLGGWLAIGAVVASSGIALAQRDYSAGKTPEQLFVHDCSACHASPQGLARSRDARSLTGFLREHYTTQTRTAALLANYLVNAPPAIQAAPTEAKKGNERDTKSAAETLDSKLRGYATAGQEAKPPAE